MKKIIKLKKEILNAGDEKLYNQVFKSYFFQAIKDELSDKFFVVPFGWTFFIIKAVVLSGIPEESFLNADEYDPSMIHASVVINSEISEVADNKNNYRSNNWISVKDRMPAYDSSNPYKSYLVCDANEGDCTVARREDPKYKDWSFQADLWQSEYVTHWMPLPEPPEVDG